MQCLAGPLTQGYRRGQWQSPVQRLISISEHDRSFSFLANDLKGKAIQIVWEHPICLKKL